MLPKVNEMLYYHVASSDEAEATIEYRSRIADETQDTLLIEYPLNEATGRMKRLYLGDELSVYFVSSDGVKHYFDSHVTGFVEDTIRQVVLLKPDPAKITTVQRRSFLRVSAELELAVKVSAQARFVCLTDDIGGGGISFICDSKWALQTGQEMECWLLIPYKNGSIEHAFLKAEVVRVKTLETGRLQAMLKYISITETERQKIIRFCFERQLEFRNR
ncbi:flagellar brake domain-containing protein [Paenibacillus sp. HB172176]|uniref:flagellar brake protein n=1 Tax=Paenibacillus sp. HB172176 TaxID=2493690 RepID=UPI001439C7B3|nr:flagellar brake domain-containing protein [Paenibacillus sp. HB172176]